MLFISPQKLFSFSRYLNFCLTFWSCSKTASEKDEFNFKFYDVTSWLANNILRRTGNQTMKFGQLKEYNMRNIFLEKSCTEYGEKTSPRPFSEK